MEPLHLDQLCSICQTSDTPETTSSFWTLHTCVEWMSSCVSDTLGTQISSGRHGSWSLDCGPGYHPGTIDKWHLSSQLSSPPYFSGMLWLYWSQMRFWLNGSGPKVLWKQAGAFLIQKALMISLLPDPTHTTLRPKQTQLVLAGASDGSKLVQPVHLSRTGLLFHRHQSHHRVTLFSLCLQIPSIVSNNYVTLNKFDYIARA